MSVTIQKKKERKEFEKDEVEDACSEAVEDLVEDLKEEDFSDFIETLEMVRRVHGEYSLNNTALIKMQIPGDKDAREPIVVNGYNQWQELGRQVKKGETGIKILAPSLKKACPSCGNTKSYHDKSDCDDNTTYENWGKKCFGFFPVHVFDICQTEEVEDEDSFTIPDNVKSLSKYGADEGEFEEIRRKFEGFVNSIEVVHSGKNGLYNPLTKEIEIRKRNEASMIGTLIHELAHHFVSQSDRTYTKEREEMFVESVSYVVCQEVGISAENSKKYIKAWEHHGEDTEVLVEDMEEIVKVSSKIVNVLRED